MTFSQCSRYK